MTSLPPAASESKSVLASVLMKSVHIDKQLVEHNLGQEPYLPHNKSPPMLHTPPYYYN
jgi:hypothetical protein